MFSKNFVELQRSNRFKHGVVFYTLFLAPVHQNVYYRIVKKHNRLLC